MITSAGLKAIGKQSGRSYVSYAVRPHLARSIQFAPKRLISAVGGVCAPSRTFVCPQKAIKCFEGCHVTVETGPAVGTRWIGMPVSTAHFETKLVGEEMSSQRWAYDVDICARVGNGQILSVVRKAQRVDRMAIRDVRQREMRRG